MSAYIHPYDGRRFDPAMPIAEFELVSTSAGTPGGLTAIVDVDLYFVTIRLGPHTIYGIQAVAAPPGSEPVLGRDVLNELEITLNGPAQELWIA